MIEVVACAFRYPGAGTPALDDVTLHVPDGAFVVVAGASGSGKSTLAHAIVGAVPHLSGGTFSGSVRVAGRDTREHRPRELADVVGLVGQDAESQAVTDHVEDEICFAMENLGVAPVLMRKRLEETLDALDLAGLRHRSMATLSGGERQRVAIAAVLAAQPRVLVLDEPTSQLDPQSAEDVLGVLQRLNSDLGLAIVCVEHRLERVAQYADRIVVLAEGRIVADDEPRAVLGAGHVATPLSRLARALGWGSVPLTVREGRTNAAGARVVAEPPSREAARGAPVVRAHGLGVALGGREVLRDVSLEVAAGETLAVVGRNGSGKTTLLRALLGLVRAHAGSRTIAGLDPATAPLEAIAGRVGYVPQAPDRILFRASVREEIAATTRARSGGGDPDALLAGAGLEELAAADPRDLSAGQRLRVAILAATAGASAAVLLDEPTRGMDDAGKDDLVALLAAWRAQGRAVIVVTHDVELVARAATRVALMANGRVVLDGPVREVLGDSPLFSSLTSKVFGDPRILTVEDALAVVTA